MIKGSNPGFKDEKEPIVEYFFREIMLIIHKKLYLTTVFKLINNLRKFDHYYLKIKPLLWSQDYIKHFTVTKKQ